MGRIGIVLLSLLAGLTSRAVAQDAVFRGTVRSEAASLIPGVSVTIAELAIGISTAASGRYQVSIAGAHVRGQTVHVRFRRDGYRSRIEALVLRAGEQTLDVTLERDLNGTEATARAGVLDSTPRTAATVAVARVDAVDMPVPGVNPLAQLAGHVAGLGVFSASGRPGTVPDVIVRGMTSLNATGRSLEPLYVIDGIVVSGGLAAIDPRDIATFVVERGTAGASVYGARGANGVITISTRSAGTVAERATFGLRSEMGMSDIEREIQLARQHALLLSADGQRFCVRNPAQPLCAQTVDWATETNRVNNYPGNWADLPVTFAFDPGSATSGAPLRQVFLSNLWPVPTYNPVRQVMIARPYVSTSVDATGGIADARYFASLSQLRQQGAIRYLDGFTRYTARLNVDRRIGSTLWLAVRSFFSRGLSDGVSQNDGGNLFFALTRQCAACNVLARDTLGRLYARSNIMSQGDLNGNPLLYTAGNGFIDATTTERFIGGGTLRWSPASWADVEANVSYDRSASRYQQYLPRGFRTQGAWAADSRGFLEYDDYGGETWNGSLSLTLRQTPLRALLVQWHLRYLFERLDTYADVVSGDPLAFEGPEAGANASATRSFASNTSSERLAGLVAGVSLGYRDKLFGDLLVHRDGSWLLGSAGHWASFGRASLAYRLSQERWWRWTSILNEFKLRASYGSAGSRPRFSTQHEMFAIGSGGTLGTPQLANGSLRPETTAELELGADLELFRRIGVTLTYAHSDTKNQILPVSIPTAPGFGTQWQNAGTLANRTWELSVNVPLAHTRDLNWSWRFNYDRTRTVITKLDVPPFRMGSGTTDIINIAEGERYGTIYGRYLLRGSGDCARLPVPFGADCGTATSAFQVNDDGYLVWVGRDGSGQAFGWRDGLTKNLWMTQLPSASAPWGIALNWGMPITLRDSVTTASVPLGTGLPDWRLSVSQTLQYRRLTLYALLEGVVGRSVWNQGRHWSYLDFINRDVEQRGRDPGVAKPIGYYYRAAPPDNASGINGLYQTMVPSNVTVEDASFAKLRELAITYHIGQVGGAGDWAVSVIGRNVFTLTAYKGFDPEVGIGGGQSSSALVNAVDAYTFPNLRTFTVALSSKF